MNILVLNGSPKGDNSVTMASIIYLQVVFPQYSFNVKHIAQNIHQIENNAGPYGCAGASESKGFHGKCHLCIQKQGPYFESISKTQADRSEIQVG